MNCKHWFFVASTVLWCVTARAVPEHNIDTEGTIEFEQEGPKASGYLKAQDDAISALSSAAESAAAAHFSPVHLSPQVMQHLALAHLFCTVKQGTCATVLEGLWSLDFINDSLSKSVSCDNLKAFWLAYKGSSYGEQEKHLGKIGFAETLSRFQAEQLPRYMDCSISMAKNLPRDDAQKNLVEYFRANKSLVNLAYLLKQIKDKVPDMRVALGLQN
jgi:hypothetical protein